MKRLAYLDALRGLAAMTVVVYHFINWHWKEHLEMKVGSIFFNGADAVSFFFVLSGFVLSYKYFQDCREIDIPKFFYKRVLRLYPAFIVTVLINYLYANRYGLNVALLGDMFFHNEQRLWQELFMLKLEHKFYNPGWTLGVEMALSLFMPFLVILARKEIKLIVYLLGVSFFLAQFYVSLFLFHFLLGILLAYYYPRIQAFQFSESRLYPYRFVLPFAILLLFSARHFYAIHSFGSVYDSFSTYFGFNFYHYSALATFAIIFAVINCPRMQKFLESPALLFLGKISYSIYLCHWVVVVYVMRKWETWSLLLPDKRVVFVLLLLATIVVTLILSVVLYYLVEKPSMKLSYRTAEKFFPKDRKIKDSVL